MTSLDIQVAEQDEGIHSDVDFDFFESDQKLEPIVEETRRREQCEQSKRSHSTDKLNGGGADKVGALTATERENSFNTEDHIFRDESEKCVAYNKNIFFTKAVIEANKFTVEEESVQEVNKDGEEIACNTNKTKLEINLQNLIEKRSDGPTISSSRESSESVRERQEEETKCCSPPCMLRDNGKYRELMNCIAFQTLVEEPSEDGGQSSSSPFTDSVSSDTTSDLTDVTARSLSGCSSVLKCMREECHRKTRHATPNCYCEKLTQRQQATSMKLLTDAIKHLHKSGSSVISNSSSGSSRSASSRLNMTFTNEEIRKIEWENGRLLKKIQSNKKPHLKPGTAVASQPRLASSAINRRRMQQRIEYDNLTHRG
ncbi:hypothetical protein PR048_019267 [Dryococelus australis]|uniref:Cilia- and flagella-associated protein 97 n=1 Tax=Dryococelus australis TaxID=614101 RepID=A0ABQ9H338_9NEOP|nr:hypothetical protein PR048_019267 [Dryococelus australis]